MVSSVLRRDRLEPTTSTVLASRIAGPLRSRSQPLTTSSFVAPPPIEPSVGLGRRFELFRRYGNFTMAYATLQPGMKYFEAHRGYLAYDECSGTTFVLGDPVAPAEKHAALIQAFGRKFPRACVCQISPTAAGILALLGSFVN